MLVDTSVWIAYFNGQTSQQSALLTSALHHHDYIAICGIVMMEILQGIRTQKDYNATKTALEAFDCLSSQNSTFILSADIYRSLKQKGCTPRKSIDCLIAATAIETKLPLLHQDKDFLPIAKHCGLTQILGSESHH